MAYVADKRTRQNGGEMGACMNYDYERDYILEAIMRDKMIQAKKARKKSFDLRKTTKAHEGNLIAAKKRIADIEEKEASDNRRHVERISVGLVPHIYPTEKAINRVLGPGTHNLNFASYPDKATAGHKKDQNPNDK